jgi:hypothetical protein
MRANVDNHPGLDFHALGDFGGSQLCVFPDNQSSLNTQPSTLNFRNCPNCHKRQNETKWSRVLSPAFFKVIGDSRAGETFERTKRFHFVALERVFRISTLLQRIASQPLSAGGHRKGLDKTSKNLERHGVLSFRRRPPKTKCLRATPSFSLASPPQLSSLNPQPSFAFPETRLQTPPLTAATAPALTNE